MTQSSQPHVDLLLKGGRVIDPANNIDGQFDVAVSRTRVSAVEADIPSSSAHKVVDVSGLLVVPGLIDLHAHFCGFQGLGFTRCTLPAHGRYRRSRRRGIRLENVRCVQ